MATLNSIAKKTTNQVIKMAHTSKLQELLLTFNYHYSKTKERSREELKALVRKERNRILWGQYATA